MDVAETQVPPADLVLDPFVYVPDMASKIDGLGGNARGPDGDYAFHTAYVEAAEGVAHFSVHFEGLAATQGTLNLRVHMLSADSPHARLATAERVALNRLVSGGGHYEIRFEAFHGVTYALYGGIIGDTDATAHSLRVILDRPADPNARRDAAAEARNTAFGSEAVPVPHLVSLGTPTLTAPVTQLATARQLKSDTVARWIKSGALAGSDDLGRWRAIYVLEALRTYGMMEPGARGAGMGALDHSVIAGLAGRGLEIDLVVPPGSGDIAAADNLPHVDPELGQGVTVRTASLAPLAPDLVNYDFIWTRWTADEDMTLLEHARFIEAAIACLRPGGVAVHVVDYDPAVMGSGRGFARQDVERIILLLISRGHDLAEFRIDPTGLLIDHRGISACGIICRKAPLRD
ncbi:MAG: hypothetical protein DI605_07040 [Sphingomonas sp.]|nr:MAG: hypothetical protein DI605_07040 [Sphingomonas sp.]